MADTHKIPGQAAGDQIAQSASSTTAAEGGEWMKLAKDAYSRSTTYFDNNYRKQWEDGLRMFNSQHPRDSKYNSDTYKYRSRVFRPKSRSVVRKHEAIAAQAFFSNPDVVTIDPVDEDSDEQIMSASITKELLQYRLTKSIPWFLTVIGAFQDTMNVGICASFQYWDYQTKKKMVKKDAQIMGTTVPMEFEEDVPIIDKPCCELIPVPNIRFDPAAKWYDVVGTSPYLILQLPMYLRDVLDRMDRGYGKDEQKWKKLDEKVILGARITEHDPVQQARSGRKEDPQTVTSSINEFDVVMVHLNFIKTDEGCFTYYTLKDTNLLSEPQELEEAFLHGEIPVTIGFCIIETHQSMPKGLIQLGSQLQQEANEIANQRLDNVKFVLNKRWFVRRGSNVDVEGMLRNVPGGVSMVNDVEKDVREINWTDVTASSFQEQDRLNADFDDLEGGGLNSSSVMTNRRLNETVGGMKIMAQGANSLSEYTIRVFVESWVEPTLRQIVKLEQYYESDEVVLAIAAKKAGVWQRFKKSPDLDKLLKQELTLSINVGMGATDPNARFERFMHALGAYTQVSMQGPPDLDLGETRKELFGLAGFKDSKRFFTKVDPRWAQAKSMMQQAEGLAQKVVQSGKDRILRGQMQLQHKSTELDLRELSMEGDAKELEQELNLELQRMEREFEMKTRDQQLDHGLKVREANQDLQVERYKAKQQAAIEEFRARTKARIDAFLANAKAAAIAKTASKGNGADGHS
jgi:hypothetical protein